MIHRKFDIYMKPALITGIIGHGPVFIGAKHTSTSEKKRMET